MGKNLSSRGDLTVSQREHADAMGIPHAEFKQQVIDRLLEEKGGLPLTTRELALKKNVIQADNPVLIIGGGSSYRQYLEKAKAFPGKIIVLDVNFNNCVKAGIIPDYIVTLESGKYNVTKEMFSGESLKACSGKSTAVGSSITTGIIQAHIKTGGVTFQRWTFKEEPRASNCGIFALNFAYRELNADKIIIVGFEHTPSGGGKYHSYVYQIWQTDFWYFIKQWPKATIVNCSDGGALYYKDYIIDTTLDKLNIEARHNTPSSFELKQAA